MIRRLFAAFVLVVLALGFAPAPKPKPKPPANQGLQALDGVWEVTSREYTNTKGKKLKATTSRQTVTIKDGTWTWGNSSIKYKVTIDPTKTPPTIDLERIFVGGGKAKGKLPTRVTKIQGIYEINGNELKYCYGTASSKSARPMSFTDTTKRYYLYTFKRVTP